MSKSMFKREEITSRLDAQGNMVVETTSKESTVSWTPATGAVTYRRNR